MSGFVLVYRSGDGDGGDERGEYDKSLELNRRGYLR